MTVGERRTSCPHGDPRCPCNDGDGGCHYEPLTLADGTVSPASPCRNPLCEICR